jgi:hypothetical protein
MLVLKESVVRNMAMAMFEQEGVTDFTILSINDGFQLRFPVEKGNPLIIKTDFMKFGNQWGMDCIFSCQDRKNHYISALVAAGVHATKIRRVASDVQMLANRNRRVLRLEDEEGNVFWHNSFLSIQKLVPNDFPLIEWVADQTFVDGNQYSLAQFTVEYYASKDK